GQAHRPAPRRGEPVRREGAGGLGRGRRAAGRPAVGGGAVLTVTGRPVASLVLAALAAAVAVALGLSGALAPVDAALYDRLAPRLARAGADPGVVVVGIDEPSFAEIGRPWPWPRDLHARLIGSLRAAGARAIGYDIVFADPGPAGADAALAAAMGPDVVLAGDLAVIDTPQGLVRMQVDPLPQLLAAGARAGRIAMPLDPDGAIRRLPHAPDALARVLAGTDPPEIALIRYGRLVPLVSFYQALDPALMLPPVALCVKVVLVRLTLGAGP